MPFLFCLSFANRASVSGDLYIDFNRNHLIFPVAYLVCQDYAWFILFLPEHAYALHITSRISCHVHVLVVYYVVCLFPGCFSRYLRCRSGVVRICSTTSVCLLHGLVLLPCGISGKMTIPSKSLLSLLASCSLFCYAAIPTTCYIMPSVLQCQASNHPFLANRCLAMLPLLLSPSYSVVSC